MYKGSRRQRPNHFKTSFNRSINKIIDLNDETQKFPLIGEARYMRNLPFHRLSDGNIDQT